MAAPETPARGYEETAHGRRPLAGARRMLLSRSRAEAQVGGFPEADMTLARHLVVASHSATQLNWVSSPSPAPSPTVPLGHYKALPSAPCQGDVWSGNAMLARAEPGR